MNAVIKWDEAWIRPEKSGFFFFLWDILHYMVNVVNRNVLQNLKQLKVNFNYSYHKNDKYLTWRICELA